MNPRTGLSWQATFLRSLALVAATAAQATTLTALTTLTAPPAQAEPFRMVTYNIWGAPVAGKNINSRAPKIGAVLAQTGADVIAVQEAFRGCLVADEPAMIQKQVKYPYQALGNSPSGIKCASSGLQLLSRHPIIQTARLRFTTCAGTDCLATKGVLFVRIRHPRLGEIDVYNTHLNADDNHSSVRQSQVRQWIRFAQKYSGDHQRPVFIAGDLNATNDSPEIRNLIGGLELRDAYHEEILARGGDPIKLDGFTSDPVRNANVSKKDPRQRIDYLLFRPAATSGSTIQVTQSRMAFEEPGYQGKPLSDHFGLITDWELTPPATASEPAALATTATAR